jgi:hypothetical protein
VVDKLNGSRFIYTTLWMAEDFARLLEMANAHEPAAEEPK